MNFTSWCQNNNDTLPLRAINYDDTTAYVKVPIYYIKKANVKFIERKYYIKLNTEKDSIINYKNQYINSQSIIIKELTDDYYNIVKINNDIKKDLELQQQKSKVFKYSTAGLLGFIILTVLIK